jgi:hypothetical protein
LENLELQKHGCRGHIPNVSIAIKRRLVTEHQCACLCLREVREEGRHTCKVSSF